MEESTARIAEELYSRTFTSGGSWKGNTGFSATARCQLYQCDDRPLMMWTHFSMLHQYLRGVDPLSPSGATTNNDVTFNASGWSLVRWAADQYATSEGAWLTVGTKFFFFSQDQGNNHYTGVIAGGGTATTGGASVGFQQTSSRGIQGTVGAPHGTWMDVEFLFIANTLGTSNGVVKACTNGIESTSASDVMFFAAGKVPGFNYLFTYPTYGGGEAPPPRNVFFRIAGWYRESAP